MAIGDEQRQRCWRCRSWHQPGRVQDFGAVPQKALLVSRQFYGGETPNFFACLFFGYYRFFIFFSSIYPVGKNFFLVETVDNSKHYKPSNKIVIDVQAGVNIFHDRVGIVKHVSDLVDELCAKWNDQYHAQPQVNF